MRTEPAVIRHITISDRPEVTRNCETCKGRIQPGRMEFYLWSDEPGFCSISCMADFYRNDEEAMALIRKEPLVSVVKT